MKKADFIIKSKNIFTGLEDEPFQGAVIVSGEEITEVIKGELSLEEYSRDVKLIECGDKLVMPGMIDAHMHFYMGACANSQYMNMEIDKSTSEEDCIRMMKEYEAKHPDFKRLLGWGWFPVVWGTDEMPSRKSLDEAFPDKEVILYCADGHTSWLNTKGLEACGLDENTELEFGEVKLDENGKPTGIVTEGACLIAFEKMCDFPIENLREMYGDIIKDLLSQGITMVGDLTTLKLTDSYYEILDKLTTLNDEGGMNIKLNIYTSIHEFDGFENELKLKEKYSKGNIRYAGLKHLMDGVTSTYTALMLEPYEDNPDSVGDPANFERDYYMRNVAKANEVGLPVRLHCIGDRSVRWALDSFEEANKQNDNPGNKKGFRNAVEHIESIHPDDIPRFKELGVVASSQPAHLTLDANEKISRIGLERCRWEWPHKSFLDAGATVCFGTDYPVIPFDPFENIYAAVTRKDWDRKPTGVNPEECISLSDALKCYTYAGAYSYNMDHEVGTLEAGKKADIVILDRNLFETAEDDIPNTKVEKTFLDGKLVYEKA